MFTGVWRNTILSIQRILPSQKKQRSWATRHKGLINGFGTVFCAHWKNTVNEAHIRFFLVVENVNFYFILKALVSISMILLTVFHNRCETISTHFRLSSWSHSLFNKIKFKLILCSIKWIINMILRRRTNFWYEKLCTLQITL